MFYITFFKFKKLKNYSSVFFVVFLVLFGFSSVVSSESAFLAVVFLVLFGFLASPSHLQRQPSCSSLLSCLS